jgi:hypothetical protein
MKDSPFFYFIFAMLFWISMSSIENQNTIIIGFAFMFVVNLLFMGYFTITQIINVFSNLTYDEPLINLGKFSIFVNCLFLTISLIMIIIMIYNINSKWKKAKGMSFELDPHYQNKMDLFKISLRNNLYFMMVDLLFVVFFKNHFNNVNQLDSSGSNNIYGYPRKIIKYVTSSLIILWDFLSSNTKDLFMNFKRRSITFPKPLQYVLYLPYILIAICIAIIMSFFKIIIPDLYTHGSRYVYILAVPIFSFLLVFYSSYQLSLAGSFTKIAQQDLI